MNQRVYFPGLNAVRFYAALAVVFYHINQNQNAGDLVRFEHVFAPLRLLFPAGYHAVTLFFVLSGFLITYLLLVERQRQGTISVRKFYIRRALRILPLYYATILIAFFALPALVGGVENFYLNDTGRPLRVMEPFLRDMLIYCLLLLPNVPFALSTGQMPAAHTWSIGVEEQFYLIYPFLFYRAGRFIFWLLVGIIVARVAMLAGAWALFSSTPAPVPNEIAALWRFAAHWRLESMAIGGLGALAVFHNRRLLLNVVYSVPVQLGVYALMALHIAFYDHEFPTFDFALSILYLLFILNIATNPRSLLRLESPLWTWLGSLSYSLYMTHFLVINAVFHWFKAVEFNAQTTDPLLYNLVLYVFALGGSFIASLISYYAFERLFLRFKDRFTVVRSGSPAQPDRDAPPDAVVIPDAAAQPTP